MAVKYICAKCERKFIDWGAKKLNFKCPDCEESELTAIGFDASAKTKKKRPALKRVPKKKKKVVVPDDDNILTNDDDVSDSDDNDDDLDGFSIEDGDSEGDDSDD